MRTLITPHQFAEIYGHSLEQVLEWIETGELPADKQEDGYMLDLELIEHVAPDLLIQGEED